MVVVAMMFALAEWTLFMTLSETSNHGIGRNTDWNNRLWLNVIKASFFGCFLLLMYTLWTLAVRRKTAMSRLIFALLLSSQLFALGVLLYLGLAAGSSRTFTVLAATAVVFAAADLGFFAAMREVDRIDSLRRRSEAEKQYVENQADYFRALSERARFDNLLQERLRSRVAGAIRLLEARHVDGYRDWILNPAVDGDTRNLTLCENSVVNALLLTKLRTMEERGIAGRIQVRLASRTEFDDLDLCCVFGNLLDNAIEASAELATEKDIEPVVELIGAATGGFYVIRCRNRCLRQPIRLAEGRIQSGKRPEGEYGLGLLIIGEIAQKYGGRFDFDCEERDDGFWFRATVWLGLTNADNPAGTPATGREAVAGHAY
jgi:hypothetical protein